MKRTQKTNAAGFSLLELMIVTVVLTIVAGALYFINLTMIRATLQQEALAELRDEGRTTMQILTRNLRMAEPDTITVADDGTSVAFQVVTDVDGNGNALDSNNNVELSGVITYQINGGDPTQLVQTDANGDVTRVLLNNVSTVQTENAIFSDAVNGGVQVDLILRKPGQGSQPPVLYLLTQTITQRN